MMNKLPLADIFRDSYLYCIENCKFFGLASLSALVLFILGFYTWSTILFIPVAIICYVVWGMFFRIFFERTPYFQTKALFNSLVPSTKILVLSVLVILVLMSIPFLPPFLGLPPEYADEYSHFLQRYMEETDLVDLGLNLIFTLVSPFVFYRPFFAWVAALLGRAGMLTTAWNKTNGNYWQFVMLNIIFTAILLLFYNILKAFGMPQVITFLFWAPLTIYFNVVLAKCYDFFFLNP